MRTCPQCGAEISEQAILAGLCRACGAPLENLAGQEQPPAPVCPNLRDTDGDVMATMPIGPLDQEPAAAEASDGPAGSDTGATVDLPSGAPVGRETDRNGGMQTADFGAVAGALTVDRGVQKTIDLPPEGSGSAPPVPGGVTAADSGRIREVWAGKIPASSRSGGTLKIDSTTTLGAGTLVIKSRKVAASHGTPDAKAADYELLKQIGQGGMGVVYSARQANFNRKVAVKMLRPDSTGKNKRHEFVAEAVTTGDLDHPNIVPVYDLGTNEEGALFYAMKCVQGTPWDEALPQKPITENLEVFLKMADAIAFAHANGVIHRDLKPENIMLGSYGEVLVMDWGLAVRFEVERDGKIRSSGTSMGGTPAYMAPELVLGPMERIGPAADIYLLGAILYEIVTGQPPHTGSTPMECLYAAAANQIRPTDASGELIEIARKAMQTEPKDRYKSVLALQKAVRDYQSHSESIALLENARKQLARAESSGDYQDYSRALFGCEEAYALWPGNRPAREEASRVQLAYAAAACTREDYDLAASLLDSNVAEHAALIREVSEAKREREAKVRRLRNAKRLALALVATVLAVVTTSYFEIRKQRDRAEIARNDEAAARQAAESAEAEAIAARDDAEARRLAEEKARRDEETARKAAVAAKEEADQRRQEAVAARAQALMAKEDADRQRDAALAAKRAEEYESYVALIGLAAAKVDDNAFSDAERLLADCRESEFRNWEWGRLWHLCQQSIQNVPAGGPVESVAFGPDGHHVVLGSWDGNARIVDLASAGPPVILPHGGLVHSVAFSHNGQLVATGGSDNRVKIWDAVSGRAVRTLEGHEDAVLSVAFSPDDRWLLSSSYDGTARLWDAGSGRNLAVLQGHSWWVWRAAFSADASRIVTAGQDGRAIVWSVVENGSSVTCDRLTEFSGHGGPVVAAAFSPRGDEVASGGEDGRVLVWKPAEVRPVDLAARIAGSPDAETPCRILAGHDAPVSCVAWSADGRLLASSANDHVVKVWDAPSGKLIKALRGHGGRVRSCDFSPDGQFLVSGGHDGQAKIWSLDGYREIRVLKGQLLQGHSDILLSARYSADGRQVVTSSRDRTARTLDVATGEALKILDEGHEFLATSAVFFNDGRRLLTAAGDDTVRLWDVAAGTQSILVRNTGRIGALALSNDQQWIVTGSGGSSAQVFHAGDGTLFQSLAPEKESDREGSVTALAFSPDDRLLLVGDAHGRCRVWARAEGTGSWSERFQWRSHSRRIAAAAFLPDGSRALTASLDNTVAQWDLASGEELTALGLKHPKGVTSLAVLADGRKALTTCDDGKLRLWDLERAEVRTEMASSDPALHFVDASPDGSRALTVNSVTRKVRLWDLGTGREIFDPKRPGQPVLDFMRQGGLVWTAIFTPDGFRILSVGGNDARIWQVGNDEPVMSFTPHGAVASADYSPDGRLVVTASWDSSAKIWDAVTGVPLRKLVGGHVGYIHSAVFSPDGTTILTAGDDHTARFWDVATGKVGGGILKGHTAGIRRAAYSANGKLIVTASDDRTARIWEAATGRTVQILKGHAWPVLDAAFSADGLSVATGSEDNRARVYRVETGELLRTLEGHAAAVTAVAFSPDGSRVLTGSRDRTVKLWDARSGKEILTLRGHDQEVTSVAFAPDGRSALSASRDGTAIVWLAADWK
ncbi:MAG: WD40 domain-containing protein [Thermoguttaceae bacterium]